MQLVMAVYAEYKRCALSCYHQFLPWLLPFFHVRQVSNVMVLKVTSFCSAIFTFVRVHSFQKFASACVLEDEWRSIDIPVWDHFPFHVFDSEELRFGCLSIPSRFSHRHM